MHRIIAVPTIRYRTTAVTIIALTMRHHGRRIILIRETIRAHSKTFNTGPGYPGLFCACFVRQLL
jgi:hypothetical protein